MSHNKRSKDIFSKIIAGDSVRLNKKRKSNRSEHIPLTTEHTTDEISLSDIRGTLDRILKQNSEMDVKINDILNRVIRIEEYQIVDQEFINVLNLFN